MKVVEDVKEKKHSLMKNTVIVAFLYSRFFSQENIQQNANSRKHNPSNTKNNKHSGHCFTERICHSPNASIMRLTICQRQVIYKVTKDCRVVRDCYISKRNL